VPDPGATVWHIVTFRVLHVINRASGNAGAEISLRDTAVGLAGTLTQGLVVLAFDGNRLEEFMAAGVSCFVPERSSSGRTDHFRHVHRAIRSFGPDLVHTTLFDADLAGRVAARVAGVPVISSLVNTSYGSEVEKAEPVARWKLRLVRRLDGVLARRMTSGFHAISVASARHAVDHLDIPQTSIRVIPRGRSLRALGDMSSERRAAVRSRLGWGDRPVILNVARQEPQKGQIDLVEAFSSVLATTPGALLVIAGREGRSTLSLRRRIEALGAQDSVCLLGERSDVPDLLAAADVFAFPSLYEGLGGAAVEAMAFALPIVATDIPALREILRTDRGWLVPPGDVAQLSAALSCTLAGGDEVQARAARARQAFLSDFQLELCVERMREFYRDVEMQLDGRPKRRRAVPRLRFDQSRS
jgi:glycosyltransferase involved in cell wall biosynthesis